MRKYYSIILGVILLISTVLIFKFLTADKSKPKPIIENIVASVYVDTIQNTEIPIIITATGSLTAKNKIELYAEVQGVLKISSKEFKPGTFYTKGEAILSIADEEFAASLQSQRSALYNAITAILPDIRLDYPQDFLKWESYLANFNIQKVTPKLPETTSEKEKLFVSGRGIYANYYNVKNLEVRLSKYQIKAPFSGVLTESVVNPGTLIRIGQKLGEFIDPSVFEMQIAVNASYASYLTVGKSVQLNTLEGNLKFQGKVIRINGKVDQTSQTINVFIEVSHKDLKDGMYLEAHLNTKNEQEAIEISRKLLVNNNQIFTVNDSILKLMEVNPVYFNKETVVIRGIKNGTTILSKSVPGAYDGMKVSIITQ
ncbi:MAG: HlyD family efflux transporter periplasmic adaptor subunit [Flavobacteriaceae bacterium]|nr:HlyD family efflux transporter periplasmic adaptor subunit [Flavobacteriaceae bacterium]